MAFHVGQKVVAIRDLTGFDGHGLPSIDVGEIYTVTDVTDFDVGPLDHGKEAILINGCAPGIDLDDGEDVWYPASFFRPLQEQGMSILRAILADPKVKIKETA